MDESEEAPASEAAWFASLPERLDEEFVLSLTGDQEELLERRLHLLTPQQADDLAEHMAPIKERLGRLSEAARPMVEISESTRRMFDKLGASNRKFEFLADRQTPETAPSEIVKNLPIAPELEQQKAMSASLKSIEEILLMQMEDGREQAKLQREQDEFQRSEARIQHAVLGVTLATLIVAVLTLMVPAAGWGWRTLTVTVAAVMASSLLLWRLVLTRKPRRQIAMTP